MPDTEGIASEENEIENENAETPDLAETCSLPPVVLAFTSPRCAHCRQLKPALDQTARVWKPWITTHEVNVDTQAAFADAHGVHATPTLVAMLRGQIIGTREGVLTASELHAFYTQIVQADTAAGCKRSTAPFPTGGTGGGFRAPFRFPAKSTNPAKK